MSEWLSILSASGSIATAASVVSAFVLYKKEINNNNLTKVRKALQIMYTNINEIDELLGIELAYEMASTVVYSRESQYSIKEIYNICNDAIENGAKKERVIESIKDSLGVFVLSFHDDLLKKYNMLLSEISYHSVVFNPNFKGLYRFTRCVIAWFRNILINYKQTLINEKLLSEFIYNEMVQFHGKYKSYECFQKELSDYLLSLIESGRRDDWQKEVDYLLGLINMVYSAHIELTDTNWNKLRRKISKIELKPYMSTKNITDDLMESEKHFRSLLSHDESMEYVSLVKSLELKAS